MLCEVSNPRTIPKNDWAAYISNHIREVIVIAHPCPEPQKSRKNWNNTNNKTKKKECLTENQKLKLAKADLSRWVTNVWTSTSLSLSSSCRPLIFTFFVIGRNFSSVLAEVSELIVAKTSNDALQPWGNVEFSNIDDHSQHLVSELRTLYWDLKKVVTWWLVTLNTRMTCVFSVFPSGFPNISRVSPCPGAQLPSPVNPIDVITSRSTSSPMFLSHSLRPATATGCCLHDWSPCNPGKSLCHAMPMLCKHVQRSRSFKTDEKSGSTNMHTEQQVRWNRIRMFWENSFGRNRFRTTAKTWQNYQTAYCKYVVEPWIQHHMDPQASSLSKFIKSILPHEW